MHQITSNLEKNQKDFASCLYKAYSWSYYLPDECQERTDCCEQYCCWHHWRSMSLVGAMKMYSVSSAQLLLDRLYDSRNAQFIGIGDLFLVIGHAPPPI